MLSPLVSVVIPVYNAEAYLKEAILSVLNQTYNNLEVIVINDGSTDNSDEIIRSLALCDNRIVYISRYNKGLISTLNEAVALAKGDYIARMDADDVCFIYRIERQVDFMNENGCFLCFSGVEVIDENGGFVCSDVKKMSHTEMTVRLFFASCFYHPSVMMRREVFDVFHYDFSFVFAEDYKLWSDCFFCGDKSFGYIEEALLKYRVHGANVSISFRDKQLEVSREIGFYNTGMPLVFRDSYNALFDIYSFSKVSSSLFHIFLIVFRCSVILSRIHGFKVGGYFFILFVFRLWRLFIK